MDKLLGKYKYIQIQFEPLKASDFVEDSDDETDISFTLYAWVNLEVSNIENTKSENINN